MQGLHQVRVHLVRVRLLPAHQAVLVRVVGAVPLLAVLALLVPRLAQALVQAPLVRQDRPQALHLRPVLMYL